MLDLKFTAKDVARTRFAISPLWEVIAAIRVLKAPAEHPLHRPWVERVRPRLAGMDLRPLSELIPVPAPTLPAWLCPPPVAHLPDLGLELATLRATPRDRLDGRYDDPDAALDRLATTIEQFWAAALAPYWPPILTLLEGDVLYRARRLVEGGADRLFADLDRNIRWTDETLSVRHRHVSGTRTLDGRGLLLVPSAFIWPHVFSVTTGPWQPTLRYPPRGIATLWETEVTAPPEALAKILGRTRARLLAELHAPVSTQDLARRTGLSPGAVNQHLTALKAADLVSSHRTGRYVMYTRTTITEQLLAGSRS
jgi:DNA-binding transcriptional ArsR family regulator